jgi:hypothetical protein
LIDAWGDPQHAADRLDPVGLGVIVDEGDHGWTAGRASPLANTPTRRGEFRWLGAVRPLAFRRLDAPSQRQATSHRLKTAGSIAARQPSQLTRHERNKLGQTSWAGDYRPSLALAVRNLLFVP